MADYEFPTECRYTQEDEWVRMEDEGATIGVTDYAQQQLGDVVFLELPSPGDEIKQGEAFGVIESVKAVSDLYAPITGTVLETNSLLEEKPELVNESCYEDGWLLVVEPASPEELDGLMNAAAYSGYVAERED